MKKALAALDAESRALAVSILWLLFVQVLAMLAWHLGLLSRMDAMMHWLLIGVMPPVLALLTTELSPGD